MSLAGDNIRAARMAAGLTQKQLGDKAGIAEPTIRRCPFIALGTLPRAQKQ